MAILCVLWPSDTQGQEAAGDDAVELPSWATMANFLEQGVVWSWEGPGPVLGPGDSRDEWIPRPQWETGWLRRGSRGTREGLGTEGRGPRCQIGQWRRSQEQRPPLTTHAPDFVRRQDTVRYDPQHIPRHCSHHQTQPVDKNARFRNGRRLPRVTLEGSRGAGRCTCMWWPFGSELLGTLGTRMCSARCQLLAQAPGPT